MEWTQEAYYPVMLKYLINYHYHEMFSEIIVFGFILSLLTVIILWIPLLIFVLQEQEIGSLFLCILLSALSLSITVTHSPEAV